MDRRLIKINLILFIFCVTILVLLFKPPVFAQDWETCDYHCSQERKNDRQCYGSNIICKCLEGGLRVTDGLGNTTREWWWVKITECEGKCVEDYSKYDQAVCLDKNGEIQNISQDEANIEQVVLEDPLPVINTGNLGSPDGIVGHVTPLPPVEYLSTISTNSNQDFWCEEGKSIRTAIGCIPITVNGLVEKLLPNIFGIAGGIAFLMMVYGFITMSTSSGDEKKVQEAKKIVTSAITGLLVAIFSLFIYKLIAVDILHIPGI